MCYLSDISEMEDDTEHTVPMIKSHNPSCPQQSLLHVCECIQMLVFIDITIIINDDDILSF